MTWQDLLVVFFWIAVVAAALAAILFIVVRLFAVRIVRRIAERAEGQIATTLEGRIRPGGLGRSSRLDDATRAKYLADIDRIARVMDRLIPLPIGGIGLDSVLGLIPVAGDLASFAASSMIVIRAAQLGAPEQLLTRLISIQCTDLLLGAVPGIGDLVDVAYQADVKCARLIHEFVDEQRLKAAKQI